MQHFNESKRQERGLQLIRNLPDTKTTVSSSNILQ